MKTLISSNGSYKLYAEIVEPMYQDHERVQLKFSTQYLDSKNPDHLETKFSAMFTKEELLRLKDIL